MKPRIRAAGLLIENDSILLVKHGAFGDVWWVPPGGGVEGAETFEDCVVREVKEETGLEVVSGNLAYVREFIEPAQDAHHVELFFRVVGKDRTMVGKHTVGTNPDGTRFAHSILDVRWITKHELLNGFSQHVAPEIIAAEVFWADAAMGFPSIRYIDLQSEAVR
ncbi:MAG: NUDIX domain-containing protein [Chloroflexi bacterium]|nr:NUDIX domain-containing protein [Chloroflexota bacterium]